MRKIFLKQLFYFTIGPPLPPPPTQPFSCAHRMPGRVYLIRLEERIAKEGTAGGRRQRVDPGIVWRQEWTRYFGLPVFSQLKILLFVIKKSGTRILFSLLFFPFLFFFHQRKARLRLNAATKSFSSYSRNSIY